jgi:AraC-like DNA-binding protein
MLIALVAAGIYLYKKRPFERKEKYKTSALTPQFAQQCIKKLKHMMGTEKVYREPDISLQSLAEKLSVSSHVLSRVLNEKLNRNFSDFINWYRLEEAKKIFQTPGGA